MNFRNFYHTAQSRIKDAATSLWATGDAKMQVYFNWLLEKEGIMAEPVFQTAFPWENSEKNFAETNKIFDDNFINALNQEKNGEYRFPKDRKVYRHQLESWDTLINQGKSIAVTTGTGSGKTECFMLPVLYDIYKNHHNQNGVNALFLYPLNALIGSQKKRVDAWCKSLGGIRYAVYNGQTDEQVPGKDALKKEPELISRDQIRKTPPQILFTNPAMLEYMLVRNKDVPLLRNSQGTLRWILLDEAHTLTGSSAAEMSLLLRRVVDAFNVDVRNVRFAITSATAGDGPENAQRLKQFMANLCGTDPEQIKVISGKRVLSQDLPAPRYAVNELSDILNTSSPDLFKEVHELRKKMLSKPGLPILSLAKDFKTASIDRGLELIDKLSNRKVDGDSILPVRGHFFTRGIGGVFACTNPNCTENHSAKPEAALGCMTTIAATLCKCGGQLLELVACRSCGNQLLEAELVTTRPHNRYLRMVSAIMQDPFAVEHTDEEEEETPVVSRDRFYFTKRLSNKPYIGAVVNFNLTDAGEISTGDYFVESNSGCNCPHCGEEVSEPMHFRLSSSFINRILSDIILELTPEASPLTKEMLWKGHKYISFTDSRQGTAKISALINQDNEANWIRSHVFHKLSEKKANWRSENNSSPDELRAIIEHLETELAATSMEILRKKKAKEIEDYRRQLDHQDAPVEEISLEWSKLKEYLNNQASLKILFEGTNPHDNNPNGRSLYLNAILFDQFARRLPRERSLENLGMVGLIYPKLLKVNLPANVEALGIDVQEWRSLLKIAMDYLIRFPFHFSSNPDTYPYRTSYFRNQLIYPANAQQTNVKKWPRFERKRPQNRLALLICAGLGFHEVEEIDGAAEDQINELLEQIWRAIRNTLTPQQEGFQLDLENESRFVLCGELWLCPVKRRLIDAHFKGYSPWIKGNLSADNIRHFKISTSTHFPEFPYPFNLNEEKSVDLVRTKDWIEQNISNLREVGVWNNLHEQILLHRPLYLSAEHSAQQNEFRLKELEGQFERSEINILNCSTTMEMGVDIGGISAVVMNNVPPSPANYLQRAGRAGRRNEAQSLAFTICSPSPIGLNVMRNPSWALDHKIAPPLLSFNSQTVVERHMNAFFLGKFVQTSELNGINIKMITDRFFFQENMPIALQFASWLQSPEIGMQERALKRILLKTSFENKSFIFLRDKVSAAFQELTDRTNRKRAAYDKKLEDLSREFGEQSPAYRTVQFQRSQFIKKNAIGYLAEQGFLPSAGLPTGIVEFDTLNVQDLKAKKEVAKPSYFITRALSEFAPGNQVVIDGKCYVSEGIILENDRGGQAEREIIQSCQRCGYQRIIEVAKNEHPQQECPHCKENTFRGINFRGETQPELFTEMIQPAGFAVDIYKRPTRKINEASSTNYVDPLLINIKPWENESTALFDVRESDELAEILFYHIGRGKGYAVCLHCGKTALDADALAGHKRLRGGKTDQEVQAELCSGNTTLFAIHSGVILGGRFKTDFCEIRIKDERDNYSSDQNLLYTLGAVISKELSHFLAVEETEISFGLKRYEHFSTIFIFDTAKGGAGYSSQFISYADQIFEIARQKLADCECDKACTKCVIDRNTQWHADKLDRLLALNWLRQATSLKVPDELMAIYPGLKPLVGGIQNEIMRLRYQDKVTKIRMYGSANVNEWDLDQLPLIQKIKGIAEVEYALDANTEPISLQDKISFIQLSAWSKIQEVDKPAVAPLKTICKISDEDGHVTEYLTADFSRAFNENWGNAQLGTIYKNTGGQFEPLPDKNLSIEQSSIAEIFIDKNDPIQSNEIAMIMLEKLKGKINLYDLMGGGSFEVSYSDRYLKTPLGCILLIQFLKRLSTELGFSINSFVFEGQDFSSDRKPYHIFENYSKAADRNGALQSFAEDAGIINTQAINSKIPHYRFFTFSNQYLKLTIRPDAGIEHGWFLNDHCKKVLSKNTSVLDLYTINKKDQKLSILYIVSVELKK
jgi:DEAD/DEAH box helicase domain-containing protein